MPKNKNELVRALFNSSEFGGFSRTDQLEALGMVDSELGSLSEESLSQFGQHYNPQYQIPSAQPILESLESKPTGQVSELRRAPTFLEKARTGLLEAPRIAGETIGGELPSLLPGGLAARPFVKPTVGVLGAAAGGAAGEMISEFAKDLPVGVRGATAGFATGLGVPAAVAGAALDIAATLTSPDGQFEPQPESPDIVGAAQEGAVSEAFGRVFGIPSALGKKLFPTSSITQTGKIARELDVQVPPSLGSKGVVSEALQNVASMSFIGRRDMNRVVREGGEQLARITKKDIASISAKNLSEKEAGVLFKESLRSAERVMAKEASDIYKKVNPILDDMDAEVEISSTIDLLEKQMGLNHKSVMARVLKLVPEGGIVNTEALLRLDLPSHITFREARLLSSNIAAEIRDNPAQSKAGFEGTVIKTEIDKHMKIAAEKSGLSDTYKAFDNAREIWRRKSKIYDKGVVESILKGKGRLRNPEFVGDVIWKPRNVTMVDEVKKALSTLGPVEATKAWNKVRRRGFETAVEKVQHSSNPNKALSDWWTAMGQPMQEHLGGENVGKIRNVMQLMKEMPPVSKVGGLQAFEKGSLVGIASGGLSMGISGPIGGTIAAGAALAIGVPIVVSKLMTTKAGLNILTEGLTIPAFRRSGLFTKMVARTGAEADKIVKFTTRLVLFAESIRDENRRFQVPKPPSGPVKLSEEDLSLLGEVPNER